MTFTYTKAPTLEDKVDLTRLWLGDRDKDAPLFTDEEIRLVLSIQESPVQAAAALAMARAAEVARKVDKTIGRTKLSLSKEQDSWLKLAERLRQAGAGDMPNQSSGVGGILVGGLTRAEKREEQTGTTFEPFQFTVGMDDHPNSDSYAEDEGDVY